MNDIPAGIISVGTRLRFDGGLWEVAEMTATGVVLRDALGGLRQAGISHLLADPSTRLLDVPAGQAAHSPPGTSGLTMTEADELRALAGHVQEVLTGYQRGSEALALPGEPRPQYGPGTPKLERCQAKADELGVSVMTVRRMIWRFKADGPEGLIDQRRQRRKDPLAGADARWLDMARQVLAERTQASKPTQDLILAEVAARLDAEHGHGTVPVPKPTRARALLREITRDTSAFGGTKAKREIAGRPVTPYGRLRAMRPGEYLLLDTTRLDVFAMDPVTLRWVQAELTIAMDLYDRCVTGLRLTPVSTKAVDAAAVLFESVRPLPEPAAGQLLLAIEKDLVLAGNHPGMVADDLADYLFARSTGHFASLMTLITRGCRRAIRAGTEELTLDLLDQVRNDAAAEAARQGLQAAFGKGMLSARPSAAGPGTLAAAGCSRP